jgi:hypothetical protein
MKNKLYQELLCDFLLNKDLLETKLGNEKLKATFRKDESKDFLYSTLYVNENEIPFIYKLSKEIENCKKINELKSKKEKI